MSYDAFLNSVKENMEERMPGKELHIQKFPKNNGVVYDGLVIFDTELNISPTIYLNPYYHWYLNEVPMEEICDSIENTYNERLPEQNFDTESFTDYENAKDKLVVKLINYEKNSEFLETVPHIKFMDLAIVLQFMVKVEEDGFAMILITNNHLRFWDKSIEELYSTAIKNTPKLLPVKIENLEELLGSIMQGMVGDSPTEGKDNSPVYIISNEAKVNGAATILYEGVLKEFAEKTNTDFIMLPSSIHEWLLIPTDNADQLVMFNQIVKEVNKTQLQDGEILADHAYYYLKSTDKIYTAAAVN